MLKTTLYVIAGSSGVGKSTQVLFLHEFLKSQGYELRDLICEKTGMMIGYVCEELGLSYIGEDVIRDGKKSVMRWQGIDNIGRARIAPTCAEQFVEVYKILDKYDVVIESMMHSVLPGLRPKQVEENTQNAHKVVVLNYFYEDFDERDKRTSLRRAIKGINPPKRNNLNKGGERLFMKDPSDRVAMDYTARMVKDQKIYDLTLKIFTEKGIDKEREIKAFADSIDPRTFNLNTSFKKG